MTDPLTRELHAVVSSLDLPPGDVGAVLTRGESLTRRRRHALAIAALLVAVAGTVTTTQVVREEDGSSVLPITGPDPAASALPVRPPPAGPPPPRPVPADLADPSPTPQDFPMSIQVYNEGVGAKLRHRTGGPYLSEADIRGRVRQVAGCDDPRSGARCDGVVVRFFDSYASAYRQFGAPVWQYNGGFGHDREVYLATVYGAFPFCAKGISGFGCPAYREHVNLVLDATTGEP